MCAKVKNKAILSDNLAVDLSPTKIQGGAKHRPVRLPYSLFLFLYTEKFSEQRSEKRRRTQKHNFHKNLPNISNYRIIELSNY